MATYSSILAWRIHGQRSLVGYSPQGRRESDTTEATQHTYSGELHKEKLKTYCVINPSFAIHLYSVNVTPLTRCLSQSEISQSLLEKRPGLIKGSFQQLQQVLFELGPNSYPTFFETAGGLQSLLRSQSFSDLFQTPSSAPTLVPFWCSSNTPRIN